MKKVLASVLLVAVMCVATGCSNSDQDRIDNAAEQAVELQEKAQDVVDDVNEQTLELEEQATGIEAKEFKAE